MRKRLVAAVMAVALLAVGASVAWAANVYEVDIASTSPVGKGTPKKPLPVKLGFGYEVSEEDTTIRPTVIEEYKIAPEGLITYAKKFPTCTFSQASVAGTSTLPRACNKAIVGEGLVRNNAGPVVNRSIKLVCNLGLSLYNISDAGKNGGMAIRLDGDPPPPADPETGVGCTIAVHTAIKAPFFPVKVQGVPTHELRFKVPIELQQPAPGLENSVIDVSSTVFKKTAKAKVGGKRRTVGYYSEVGCKGSTRTVRVKFVDTQGRSFTANKPTKC